jgi:iron complex outermembrane receptor protein
MSFQITVPTAPGVRSAIAVACFSCSLPTLAQPMMGSPGVASLEPVVVSASRLPQLLRSAPIGATVITAEQISSSGVVDASEAVRKLGGLPARSDLNNGRDPKIDLRGYGDSSSSQNVVVLVDGVRISENELAGARLSSIPLDRIDRIEVIRGGASVLWGEGASAGVINVILKQGASTEGSGRLMAAVESFDGHELLASGQKAHGPVSVDGSARRVRSEGHRDNGRFRQDVGSLGVQWREGGWHAGWRVQSEDQASGLPGNLSADVARRKPGSTTTPDDHGSLSEVRQQAQLGWQSQAWSWQVDAGHRERDAKSHFVSYGSKTVASSVQKQVTPRISWHGPVQGVEVRLTGGLDWQDWSFDKLDEGKRETGAQTNHAHFFHANLDAPTGTRVSVGSRRERVSKAGDYPGKASWGLAAVKYSRDDRLHAEELGVSQALAERWSVYVRASTSYRLANVDENRSTPGQQALKPQRNRDSEMGVKWGQGAESATVRYFEQRTRDEILYVESANTNIDPTRRRGVEAEARVQLLPSVNLLATVQQLTAVYTAGPNAGKSMVLVSPRSATLRASWRIDDQNRLEVGAQYLASARYDGDQSNTCSMRVPSATLLDARYAWRRDGWTVALSGHNLTDRQGWNYGYSYRCGMPSVYPYAGRSWRLSASRAF